MRRMAMAILFSVLLPFSAYAQADPQEARDFIASLGEKAVEILSNQNISLEEREAELREVVAKSFDVRTVGRFVLGNAWKQASESQREDYLLLYEDYTVQTYTQRLGGYSRQTLTIKDAKIHNETQSIVDTVIQQDGAEDIRVRWLVRSTDNGPRILDIVINGTSLARAQRTEFQAIIAEQDFEGLLQLMRLQVSKFSAQS